MDLSELRVVRMRYYKRMDEKKARGCAAKNIK
jgi:hypothetical protein